MTLNRILGCCFAACLIAASAPRASCQTAADAKKAIQAIFDKDAVAYGKKDMTALLSTVDPGFTDVGPAGNTTDYTAAKKSLFQMFLQMKSIRYTATILKLTMKDGGAIVNVKERVVFDVTNPRTKKLISLQIDAVSDDTFKKKGGKWMQMMSHTISQSQATPVASKS